ncbi:oxidoreductase, partial [Actinosynnema sp.]|uniref:oxidoreductase n=1 Tax=Actinosynnema sp. TaxID=1872144 RepID=UPI003F87DBF7
MAKWTEVDIPDQAGRTALVTGANSGLGLRTAEVLAARGARVLLACRSRERGLAAVERVSRHGEAELVRLDLGELASVRAAAERVLELTGGGLDLLVNNAGLMAPPLARTADGFESQFGVNHLGHAALTWLLMPALRARAGARVVTVSSVAHRLGGLDLADPNFEVRRYAPWVGYGQSKLANLLFARELDRRLRLSGADVTSVAAHPGVSRTELSSTMAKAHRNALVDWAGKITDALSQSPAAGALPQLYAAPAPLVSGGGDYG